MDILSHITGRIRQRKLYQKNKQSIWLITIPKSGSMYIGHTLSECFSLKLKSTKYFPEVIVDPTLAEQVGRGKCVCHAHTVASKNNIDVLLDHGVNKCIVHVRDPRQCILSWVYWLNEGNKIGVDRNTNNPALPMKYYSMSIEDQISWQIANRLPLIVEMVTSWMDIWDNTTPPFNVLFTSFDEMKSDSDNFFKKIFDFYQVEHESFSSPKKEQIKNKSSKYHYRKGQIDEWRETFNSVQKKSAWEIISPKMKELFELTE